MSSPREGRNGTRGPGWDGESPRREDARHSPTPPRSRTRESPPRRSYSRSPSEREVGPRRGDRSSSLIRDRRSSSPGSSKSRGGSSAQSRSRSRSPAHPQAQNSLPSDRRVDDRGGPKHRNPRSWSAERGVGRGARDPPQEPRFNSLTGQPIRSSRSLSPPRRRSRSRSPRALAAQNPEHARSSDWDVVNRSGPERTSDRGGHGQPREERFNSLTGQPIKRSRSRSPPRRRSRSRSPAVPSAQNVARLRNTGWDVENRGGPEQIRSRSRGREVDRGGREPPGNERFRSPTGSRRSDEDRSGTGSRYSSGHGDGGGGAPPAPRHQFGTVVPDVGKIYQGVVHGVESYGAFVRVNGWVKDGMVHVTNLNVSRPEHAAEVLEKGQRVWVKCVEVAPRGPNDVRISLSMKVVDQRNGKDLDPGGTVAGGQAGRAREREAEPHCGKCGGVGHYDHECANNRRQRGEPVASASDPRGGKGGNDGYRRDERREERPPPPITGVDRYGQAPMAGRGRGRDATLPAWMTQRRPAGPISAPPEPLRLAQERKWEQERKRPRDRSHSPPPPFRDSDRNVAPYRDYDRNSPYPSQGAGRGRHATLPAWMTAKGGIAPDAVERRREDNERRDDGGRSESREHKRHKKHKEHKHKKEHKKKKEKKKKDRRQSSSRSRSASPEGPSARY